MTLTLSPGRLAGELLVPASKSHTIRAILIASLAGGESRIRNALDSADARSCIAAARHLGAEIQILTELPGGGLELLVRGTGGRLQAPASAIDVGNSGTTLYLAAGLACHAAAPVTFTGDEQIRSRPAGNLLQALTDLGAGVRSQGRDGKAPFTVTGPLRGGKTRIECPTSQYLSSLLLAAPLCPEDTEIEVPLLNERPYAGITLSWLDEQGIAYEREGWARFKISGRQSYKAFDRLVPGDFSSATFFFCAAALGRSRLRLLGLDMNDSQGDKEVLGVLERMGCRVTAEPGAVAIEGGQLKGCEIDLNSMPDALPALAVVACSAEGTTRIHNVPQARLKETDRISVMAGELSRLGAKVEELPDGLVIHGRGPGSAPPLHGGAVDGHGDHRVVMALAIAALGAGGDVSIETAEAAAVTYPGFFKDLERLRTG